MEKEELKKKLNDNFSLAAYQDKTDRGYKLRLRTDWNDIGCNVRGFRVQLVGINPLSGEDVKNDGIEGRFSFDCKEYMTRGILTYHGCFYLQCTAILGDGETVMFREQKIDLHCPENRPVIKYTVRETGGFKLVEIRSNCWKNYRGKVWARFDGHDQNIDLPAGADKTVCFYLNAAGNVELKVQDDTVILQNER